MADPKAPVKAEEPKEVPVKAGMVEIVATKKIGDVEKSATVNYNFGANLTEATQMFGAEVVHTNFIGKAKITAQAAMRRLLEASKSQAEIVTALANWKPGVAMERVHDPVASLLNAFPSMSEEAQNELLERLKKARAAKK